MGLKVGDFYKIQKTIELIGRGDFAKSRMSSCIEGLYLGMETFRSRSPYHVVLLADGDKCLFHTNDCTIITNLLEEIK